ncbi:MAG: hypothetical protein WBN38_09965 [Polyangiales bacterium]
MRYSFGFLCVCLLGVMPLVWCSGNGGEGGTGGIGGGGTGGMPRCQIPEDCDDANDCTDDTCVDGTCEYTLRADGTACDESNECTTTGMCAGGECEATPVQDGNPCGGETYDGHPRGDCYGGLCNFVSVSVTIGAKDVVFDWTTDRCEDFDVPDCPAKVVRAEDGELVLFDGTALTYYLSRGADFDGLERVCDPPALVSTELLTPESYQNEEWLWSPYREGASWHVLIHNEFHDPLAPSCSDSPCWYNSITSAVSTDGARSFVKPGAPNHVVAPAPRLWTPPDTPVESWYVDGYFEPTNIVVGPDNYYYALITRMRIDPTMGIDLRGVCAMRTKTLGDPASWRAWDGGGFNLPLTSPYVAGGDVPECEVVALPPGAGAQSLSYNTYLGRYMSVDSHLIWEGGKQICGFVFSTSLDLIHWSDLQLITPARIGCDTDDTTPGQLEPVQVAYPSIIDHLDSSANFERPGRTPYLYYTRVNDDWLDRDVVRVPVTFMLED